MSQNHHQVFAMETGVEVVHIASILGDRGTVLAFNVEQRLLPLLNERIITLGVNSNSLPIIYLCNSWCMHA